jgi:hypothetical protein
MWFRNGLADGRGNVQPVARARRAVVLSLLVVSLSAAGCGATSTDAGEEGTTSTSMDFVANYDIVGGSGPEIDLLAEIVEKTRPAGLRTVRIGPVPEDAVPPGAEAETVAGTEWLTFEHVVAADRGSYIDAWWRSSIIATAFRRLSEERGLPLIRGYTARSRSPEGELLHEEVLPILTPSFEWDGTPAATDVEPLRAKLTQGSASVIFRSLEVAQPAGAAPIITLETSDPAALFDDKPGDLRFVGDLGIYEGHLIRMLDPNGELVWIEASATRGGAQISWARPGLRSDG